VARLEAPDCTPAERETFEDWLAEDPAHVTAWIQAETLFQQGEELAADPWLRTAAARAARPARAAGCRLRPRPQASAWPSGSAGWWPSTATHAAALCQ
jgi:ferric-dicitrate binding protein FerR (iron transport regulator)